MANVELGEMVFDHDSLQEVLKTLDRIIGKHCKDFNLMTNQGQGFIKLVCRCRHCKRFLIRSEENYNVAAWAERLVNNLITEAEAHNSQRHQSLLITSSITTSDSPLILP